jgi:hypothetical protein
MRIPIILSAAAPLALLAACGDSTPADEAEPTALDEVAPTQDLAAASIDMPEVPANSLASVDYPGSYAMTDAEGRTSRITLRDDDTYDYTGPDGTSRTGRYTRLDDGSRIMIEDFDGRAGYFSVADGAIYRLEGESTPYNEITVTGMYRRENAPVPEGGPGATTDTVADKRG